MSGGTSSTTLSLPSDNEAGEASVRSEAHRRSCAGGPCGLESAAITSKTQTYSPKGASPLSEPEPSSSGRLTLDQLEAAVTERAVDTVVIGFPDTQGRLQGKRCAARFFLDEVALGGVGACDYLLSVNVEMEPQEGFPSSWSSGFGDFHLRPDLDTLRLLAWRPGTALCIADVVDERGVEVEVAPRTVLKRQLERLAAHGWTAAAATELEFIVHRDSYADAWTRNYHDLTPINRYNVDYSLFGQVEADPLIDDICRRMQASGMYLETAKGEANRGQHEINFKYADPLTTADQHLIFKAGVKELAFKHGVSATFMAKWDEREGNSCHVHLSLTDRDDGHPVFAQSTEIFEQFLAGQLATLQEFTLLYAPNINSYKRFAGHSFAPTAVAWGEDNRTVALRAIGAGPARRYENRLAGADVNPYLALAANIAAGLHGVANQLTLPEPEKGDAYAADHETVPPTLRDAREQFMRSAPALDAFGPRVVEHYGQAALVELREFNAAVTDWERKRGYERL
ncbi:glutamine synthetase family protein [Kribbella sp. CA-253562]|uniref:glutamine synthetase family protein n=1 Tax=Kribbella sp. CA-253562 TaxID=3239942 RepID=UPI003D8DAAC1